MSIPIDSNCILLLGGLHESGINLNQVFKINVKKQEYKALSSMNVGRTNFGFTYLNGFYYVLGGEYDKNYSIRNCERFSLENNR